MPVQLDDNTPQNHNIEAQRIPTVFLRAPYYNHTVDGQNPALPIIRNIP